MNKQRVIYKVIGEAGFFLMIFVFFFFFLTFSFFYFFGGKDGVRQT